MPLTDAEFKAILENGTKRIQGDITWGDDEDRSSAWEFRVEVESEDRWPLFVVGRYNSAAGTLTYALILKTTGRIYALDLGKDHHNPQCKQVGDRHKHKWSERFRDKEAYVPEDVTAPVSDPLAVWQEFCTEARIQRDGRMNPLPARQGELW